MITLGQSHCRAERKAHMTDHYPAPDEHSGEVYGDAGADRPEAPNSAPLPDPVPPAVAFGHDRAALPSDATPVSADAPYVPVTQRQSQPGHHAHKNELLYAFGGILFPGLVLLLMGSKKRGTIILCCWGAPVLLTTVLIGVFPLIGTYIWSVIECFREARRQNEAHGYVS